MLLVNHKYEKIIRKNVKRGEKKLVLVEKSRSHKCLMFTFSDGIPNVNVILFHFTFYGRLRELM
jgi:hypothetical protein